MTRNRASAKSAGTRFERSVADYLAANLDDRIDRRAKTGGRDKGDIGGLRAPLHKPGRVVIECKDVAKLNLSGWVNEADVERANDDGLAGVVVAKRRGTTDPGDQYVVMTLRDLVALLTGDRP
jgi:hypothetical protein